jgi:hypothetical protein
LARLDKLIQVMHEQRAEVLTLAVGKPASLMQNGAVRHLTREALSDIQIQGLLREIASADAAAHVGSAQAVAFAYRAPTGEVHVEMKGGPDGAAFLRPAATTSVRSCFGFSYRRVRPTFTFVPASHPCSASMASLLDSHILR